MTAAFDTFAAAKEFEHTGFTDAQVHALVGNFAKSRSGMATKKDVNHCWRVILGVVVPLLLLNIGLSVSIALSICQ
ncbi:MAG: hypothetical protein OXU54_04090 [Gammaproteobacteria bacterium]|nr:hypothetical protein [Gammaproteobacteria bacterium]